MLPAQLPASFLRRNSHRMRPPVLGFSPFIELVSSLVNKLSRAAGSLLGVKRAASADERPSKRGASARLASSGDGTGARAGEVRSGGGSDGMGVTERDGDGCAWSEGEGIVVRAVNPNPAGCSLSLSLPSPLSHSRSRIMLPRRLRFSSDELVMDKFESERWRATCFAAGSTGTGTGCG